MELLKLVIVDDEPIILRGLLETYDWEQMGFEVVGWAESGEKALEVIKKAKPHLVLTDIRMKQITGLMLMDQVKVLDEEVLFIVVSAYRDFEYAQKACEMGAFSYLLKPIEEEKLYDTMKAAHAQCIKRMKDRIDHENWKRVLMEDGDNFLQVIIQKYLQNHIQEEKMNQVFSILNIPVKEEDTFLSICVDIDISYKITNQLDYEAVRFALFKYLEQVLKEQYSFWSFENEDGNRIFVLNTKSYKGTANVKKIMEEAKILQNTPVISAISGEYKGFSGLRKSYVQAIKMFEMASASGASAFTMTKEMRQEAREECYSNDTELMIVNTIRKNDRKQLKNAFIEFIYTLPPDEKMQRKYIHKLTMQVEFMLKDSYGLTEYVDESFQNFYSNLSNLNASRAVDICYKLLCKVIEERKKCLENQETEYFSEYMSIAMAYIEENLNDENLSIATVATQIYLNPVYFGRVFKNTKNTTFKQYILKRRMELAKKLIREGKESIGSICEKVGISNPSYFSQVFKQYTGVLPSEYKKEYEA